MPDHYDPLPDLAELVRSSMLYGRDCVAYAERIAGRLGIGEDDTPAEVEGRLREALGLPMSGPCELVWIDGGATCPHPAVIRLAGSCLHGHVAERQVCEGHKRPGESLWCRTCYRLPSGAHKCPVALFPAAAAAIALAPEAGDGEAARAARAED